MRDNARRKYEDSKMPGKRATGYILIGVGIVEFIFSLYIGLYAPQNAPIIFFGIVGLAILAVVGYNFLKKANELEELVEKTFSNDMKEADNVEKNNKEMIPALEKKLEEYELALDEAKKMLGYYTDFLPQKYKTIYIISFLIMAVQNQRAETLKEAINLYEEECRHEALLSSLDSVKRQSQCITDALAVVAENQAHIDTKVKHLLSLETVEFLTN